MYKSPDSVQESIRALYVAGKFYDCEFIVGDEHEKFPAHKAVLAPRSSVFEAMFYGELREKDSVYVEHFQPNAFRTMLEYIYTDEININSIEHALSIYELSDYYMLDKLKRDSEKYVAANLNSSTVCRIYELGKLYRSDVIVANCINFIIDKAKFVLFDEAFLECDVATLQMIVDQNELFINSELELINSVERWARRHATSQGKELQEILPELSPVISKLRFLSLKPHEFADGPALSPLLTEVEQRDIFIKICCKNLLAESIPKLERICHNRNPRNVRGKQDGGLTSSSGIFLPPNNGCNLSFDALQPHLCNTIPPRLLSHGNFSFSFGNN